MKVDITPILKDADRRIDFDYAADLTDMALTYGEKPATTPIRVHGAVFSEHGAVKLELVAEGLLQLQCDRCCTPFAYAVRCPFSTMVSVDPDVQESEKLVVAEGNRLDLDTLAQTALLLDLPMKHLCREDCEGICPVCGENRNAGGCGCKTD